MSDDDITVVPPEPADMQRDVEVQTGTPLLAPRHDEVQRGPSDGIAVPMDDFFDDFMGDIYDGFSRGRTCARCPCARCLCSCVFFFCCHALGELFLELCCVCRLLPCVKAAMTTPRHLKPQNRIEKFFAFLAKNLARVWVPTLAFLFIKWVLFRPIDVNPRLGTSAIHAFDLQQADAAMAATPHLRVNLTAYLLFKNRHMFYKINYDNLAVSVLYTGEKLGPVDDELPSFKQDPHESTVMRLVLVGQLRNASSTVAEMFSSDRDKGLFEMVVRIRVTLAYKSWWYGDEEFFTIYDCPFSSPFPQTGEPAFSSQAWCKTNDI